MGPVAEILAELDKATGDFQTVVVCGRNEELRRELAGQDHKHPTRVLGFASNMHELMAVADLIVTKPGGLTSSEVLAMGKPLLIVDPIPGQEAANSDFLLERGAAAKANRVSGVIVATDDRRIFDAVESFGGRAVMTRTDHPSGTDRIAEVAATLQADVIINLQGDEPQFDPADLDNLVDLIASDPAAGMATLTVPLRNKTDYRNPNAKSGDRQVQQRDPDNQLTVYVDPKNFEDQYLFEGFFQAALQTDYLHGRLSPRFVVIADVAGTFGLVTAFNYRFTDNLLGGVTYLNIWSPARKAGLGTFRAHDMVQFRLTAQLN